MKYLGDGGWPIHDEGGGGGVSRTITEAEELA